MHRVTRSDDGYFRDMPRFFSEPDAGGLTCTGSNTMKTITLLAAVCALLSPKPVLRAEAVVEAWVQRHSSGSSSVDEGRGVTVDSSGNIIVTGTVTAANGFYDHYTVKYAAADGAILWSKAYNGPGNSNDEGRAVAVDGSGNVIVAGTSVGSGGNYDYYTAKYAAADGAVLWEKRYNGTGNNTDEPAAVAVDAAGNVAVTGFSTGTGGNYDYYTAKYRAADGVQLWEARMNGTGNGFDWAYGVAVDALGNVIVTGTSPAASNNFDYVTVKYAAANGAVVWSKRYNGPLNNRDEAYAVAVDSSGSIIVTGGSAGVSGSTDCYTVKYAAANGAVLWEQRYNGPLSATDEAYALALDATGNVFIAGYTMRPPFGDQDYYVAKYAAGNGALVWDRTYNGPAGTFDRARSIAVDQNGDPIITGYSAGVSDDYCTVKYSSGGGSQLWVARYNGPANNYDTHVGFKLLALAPGGAVAVTGISHNGTNTDIATVRYRPATAVDNWKLLHLGNANAPDLGDPDGDGLTTLAEYGTGTLPHIPNAAPFTATSYIYPDGERLRLFLPRDPAQNDVTITVEAAGTPAGPWAALATSTLGAPFTGPGYVGGDSATAGVKMVQIRDIFNIADVPTRVLRIKVTR
jgi:uncharacterized delta-60 repeat protein